MTGQRGVISILMVVLLIIGAVLGHPGQFPVINDTTITPEVLYQMIVNLVAPLILLFTVVSGVFAALNARVATSQTLRTQGVITKSQAVEPGDIKAIFLLPEFWLGMVGAVVFIIQFFLHVTILDENAQGLIANAILAIIAGLTKSWGERPPGEPPILDSPASG